MITTDKELAGIKDWPSLAEVLDAEGLDIEAMTDAEQAEAFEVWTQDRTRYLKKDLKDEAMDDTSTMLQLLGHFGGKYGRQVPVFCPLCGSTDIYECCPATSYYNVRAVQRGGYSGRFSTIADRFEREQASTSAPDLFRRGECDFETESEENLLAIALRGGEVEGQVTIDNGVRVELVGPAARAPRKRWIAEVSYYHPEAPKRWVEVVGGGTHRITLPVIGSDGPLRREIVMRSLAAEIRSSLGNLEGQNGQGSLETLRDELNDDGQKDIGDALASIELGIASNPSFRHG